MTDIRPSTPSASSPVPDSSTVESIAQQDASDTRSVSSPTSRKSGSRRKSSPREPGTDCYIVLPSGQMQPVSPAEAIEESRRLASQDSPASHSATLVSALERKITDTYSGKSSESLMRLHLASCGSRTCPGCSPQFVTAQADLFNPHQSAMWLDSFPKAAFVADGYLWVRKTSAHPTAANAGGASHGEQWQTPRSARGAYTRDNGDPEKERLTLDGEVTQWATPQAHDAGTGDADRVGRFGTDAGGRNLNDEVLQNWPTPTDDDGNNATRESGAFQSLTRTVQNWSTPTQEDSQAGCPDGSGPADYLSRQVPRWATPAARDFRSPNAKTYEERGGGTKGEQLQNQVAQVEKKKQQLNPDWEETLMGWEIGWTEPLNFAPQPFPGWPMGQGPNQHPYEPPRTVPKGSCANRVARVKACGNGVVPQCADAAFTSILAEALA